MLTGRQVEEWCRDGFTPDPATDEIPDWQALAADSSIAVRGSACSLFAESMPSADPSLLDSTVGSVVAVGGGQEVRFKAYFLGSADGQAGPTRQMWSRLPVNKNLEPAVHSPAAVRGPVLVVLTQELDTRFELQAVYPMPQVAVRGDMLRWDAICRRYMDAGFV